MSMIQSHNITLYGSTGGYDIILHPLTDEHFPILYKWNTDPEVLYWSDGSEVRAYTMEMIHRIYGNTSHAAFCFLIEVNGMPIGECWLQTVDHLPNVKALYPASMDVRRIDMMIGEKDFWGKGIGTEFINMLVEFAFAGEHVDVLHEVVYDYNLRSRRVFEKNGFRLVGKEPSVEAPKKAAEDLHFNLTRQVYIERRRMKAAPDTIFELPLDAVQPSQLYISEGKLRLVKDWFDPVDRSLFDPIHVKLYNGRYLIVDGHTRAVMAAQNGWDFIPAVWDDESYDMLAYAECVRWCSEEGVCSVDDLTKRIIPYHEYEILWNKRCQYM